MYFPYLRARQFELISLRELVIDDGLSNDRIMPILEPVRGSFNSLNLANTVFSNNNFYSYLIMNPQVGDLSGDITQVLEYNKELENSHFHPAFLYSDNSKYILQSIEYYNLKDCMLICLDHFTDEEALKNLAKCESISHIVMLDPQRSRSLDRFFKSLEKSYIRLDDVFEKQDRNADYLQIPKNKFSEEHLFYADEDYQGFSDYTTLSSEYIDGGFAPRAIVIHLTYCNEEKEREIWIGHFTSETNDTIANIQGKFAEAAAKAVKFIEEFSLDNSATQELKQYFNDTKYPGLGTVKKISIKNHLSVVNEILSTS